MNDVKHTPHQRPAVERARAVWAKSRRKLDLRSTLGGRPAASELDPPRWVQPYLDMADGDFGDLDLTEEDLLPLTATDPWTPPSPPPAVGPHVVARLRRHWIRFLLLAVVGVVALVPTGCGLRLLPGVDAKDCRKVERTGEVEQTIVAEIDVSQSAVDERDDLIDQAVEFFEDRAGKEDPPSSIEVVALSNSVMTQAVRLVPPLTTDFETNGSSSNEDDDFEACVSRFEDELRGSLEGLEAYEGSDPLGGAAYAAAQFGATDTPRNVLAQFGDGYATTANCHLYQENLTDHDLHGELARHCMGGDPPVLTDVEVIQAGVGIRGTDQDPGSGDDERAVDLIAFYKEAVWPLTGARYPATVVPRLDSGGESP